MEKILVVIDVLSPDEKTLNFACYLANANHSKLTGVFLENLSYEDRAVIKSMYGSPYIETILTTDIPDNILKRKACEMAIIQFNKVCKNKGVAHYVHLDRGIPAEELIEESRFADFLIIDAETSFSKRTESIPTKFVKDVLANTECPVIISPDSFDGVDEIIFAYDGSGSSVYAIKLFTYLFPQFTDRMIRIVHVNKDDENIVSENRKLKEWLQSHYSNIDMVVLQGELGKLQGELGKELFAYLLEKENMFVVMGAYGRSWVSNLFTKSDADLVVKSINLPVFIAHY
ncbi:universal stress protein [Panacibacter ginsenosidivorans]|uniref:Universal stress protein n=1 Tax=Panacibacter ginsenosidivorans TaxID=1813871 RepID=A0A5B8VCK0_9BACT|nr:universal stress protein [Panacibacter ginsenosidivorans]QEC69200.1 universal stress protein [Panacibacter ginsenosidivorans]